MYLHTVHCSRWAVPAPETGQCRHWYIWNGSRPVPGIAFNDPSTRLSTSWGAHLLCVLWWGMRLPSSRHNDDDDGGGDDDDDVECTITTTITTPYNMQKLWNRGCQLCAMTCPYRWWWWWWWWWWWCIVLQLLQPLVDQLKWLLGELRPGFDSLYHFESKMLNYHQVWFWMASTNAKHILPTTRY